MSTDSRKGDWIQTFTRKKFYLLDPRPEDIDILDIAHALSNVCRFAGQCEWFYSVAQHSCIVSENCPLEHRVWGLLHDAAEAYIGDVSRPMKRSMRMVGVTFHDEVEKNLMKVICEKFDLSPDEPPCVKLVDYRALATERRDLMTGGPLWEEWSGPTEAEPFRYHIVPMDPQRAERWFLDVFRRIT